MELVSGLGGTFIFSDDPARLAAWYTDVFDLKFDNFGEGNTWYLVFFGLDPADKKTKLDTHFAIMRARQKFAHEVPAAEPDDMYGDQPYMINLRLRDMAAMLNKLAEKGVAVIRQDDEEYGRFAWVRDADGNRIELYQPVAAPQ